MYTDKPRPSAAYLTLLLGLSVLISGMLAGNIFGGAPIFSMAALALPILLMLACVCAAFFTRYRIEDGIFEASAWPMFRKRIPLSEIREVRRIGKIGRVLGWSIGCAGCCNRFTNGLSLLTANGVLLISPGDMDAMEAQLKRHVVPTVNAEVDREELAKKTLFWLVIIFVLATLPLAGLALPMILGKVPPNEVYGVRTAASMADEATWYVANYRGGWCMLVAAAADWVGILLLYQLRERMRADVVMWSMIALFLVTTIGAAVMSLVLIPK